VPWPAMPSKDWNDWAVMSSSNQKPDASLAARSAPSAAKILAAKTAVGQGSDRSRRCIAASSARDKAHRGSRRQDHNRKRSIDWPVQVHDESTGLRVSFRRTEYSPLSRLGRLDAVQKCGSWFIVAALYLGHFSLGRNQFAAESLSEDRVCKFVSTCRRKGKMPFDRVGSA
jgi:hypothetical protein